MKAAAVLNLNPLLKIAVMLMIGILIGRSLSASVGIIPWIFLTIATLLSALFICNKSLKNLSLLTSILALGGFLATTKEKSLKTPLPKGEMYYEAIILSEPVEHGKVIMMDLGVLVPDGIMKIKASLLRDTLTNRYRTLHVGDGIEAFSEITAPSGLSNSRFNYGEWLRMHNFAGQTFIYYNEWCKAELDLTNLSYLDRTIIALRRYRQKLIQRYERIGLSDQELAIVTAMTLGDKHLIDKETKENFSISGASHVLALSGLHLSIVYGILAYLLSLIAGIPFLGWLRRSGISELLVLGAVWSYVFLVGFSPSVVRSAIMLTIYSAISMLDRNKFSLNTLALSAIVILVVNPFILYDVGFQLSFAAVTSIFLFTPIFFSMFSRIWLQRHLFFRSIYGMLVISLSAQLGTAPLIAYYFGRFSCYSLFPNIIVVPCAALILYSSLVLLFSEPFSTLQSYVAEFLTAISRTMNHVTAFVSHLPGASIEHINISVVQTSFLYVLLLFTYLIISFFTRRIDFR